MAFRHITSVSLFATVALALISTVKAGYMRCGRFECYGAGVYCCGNSCCYFVIYSRWWFWSIWVVVIAIVASAVFCCRRARRRRAANGIVVRQAQPVYGVSTTHAYTGPGYSGPPNSNYNPYAGQTSPASAPSYQEKPPAYMP